MAGLLAATNVLNSAAVPVKSLAGNHLLLVLGVLLIIGAIVVFFLLKQIIINSVIGMIVWAIVHFVFHISLPALPTLIVTLLFGLAGIGAMLVLKFLGIV